VEFISSMNHKQAAGGLSTSEQASLKDRVAVGRERTAARVAALARDFDTIVGSSAFAPPDDEHDPEGTTIAFERAQVSALLTRAERHLADLQRAMDRLEDGTYGTCERCGQQIVLERLMALPVTQTCVHCAATTGRQRSG
jgi:RNA polymerase-binding transcription factor DksA